MRWKPLTFIVLLVGGAVVAQADLIDAFSGFETVSEIGVSGLQSSYYTDMKNSKPITGATVSSYLAELGPARVSYPSGIGEVPSPGGAVGSQYDQAMLGYRLDGMSLIVQLATALDPHSGTYNSGFKTWYGQGDLFVDVADSAGVGHYALLSAWPTDDSGDALDVNRGHFNTAKNFHMSAAAGGGTMEGHMVRMSKDSQVKLAGGNGAYTPGNAPKGLDTRVFAAGGEDLGDAGLTYASLVDDGQTWYLQSWTMSLASLSSDAQFAIGLHSSASCGNDQIGAVSSVPEPSSLLLLMGGLLLASRWR